MPQRLWRHVVSSSRSSPSPSPAPTQLSSSSSSSASAASNNAKRNIVECVNESHGSLLIASSVVEDAHTSSRVHNGRVVCALAVVDEPMPSTDAEQSGGGGGALIALNLLSPSDWSRRLAQRNDFTLLVGIDTAVKSRAVFPFRFACLDSQNICMYAQFGFCSVLLCSRSIVQKRDADPSVVRQWTEFAHAARSGQTPDVAAIVAYTQVRSQI